VGLVFSIAAALGKNFFRDAAKKIVELGDEYRVLGYGVAGTFSSATELADEVLAVFDQKVDGFSVLTSEQWTDVFLTLASRLFGLSVLVYVSTESDSVELNEDTDLDSPVLLVVRNKAGHFPVFAAEDKGSTDLRPLQISEAEAARELRKKLRELVDAGSAGLFNPLEALEKFCDKTKRKVRAKLIDTRDPGRLERLGQCVEVGASRGGLRCGLLDEWLHRVDLRLATGDDERHLDRLVDVRQVTDARPADFLTAELHARVAKQGDAAAGPHGAVGAPAGSQDAAHGLAGSPDTGELDEPHVHGLVVLALGDLRDGEGLGAAEEVHGIELVGLGGERVGDVHQMKTSS
jgi:hypothetical protein